jgi:hypothetical protein
VALSYNYTLIAQALLRLSLCSRQRPLFLKEYFSGTYSVAAYLAANVMMELWTTSISELPFVRIITIDSCVRLFVFTDFPVLLMVTYQSRLLFTSYTD